MRFWLKAFAAVLGILTLIGTMVTVPLLTFSHLPSPVAIVISGLTFAAFIATIIALEERYG